MASAPEDVLGGGGGLLHGGVDRHLHVPVQKCVCAVQTDHAHVRGRVSYCVPVLGMRQENSLCLLVDFSKTSGHLL